MVLRLCEINDRVDKNRLREIGGNGPQVSIEEHTVIRCWETIDARSAEGGSMFTAELPDRKYELSRHP